jgi:O-glycosyl hydrolase
MKPKIAYNVDAYPDPVEAAMRNRMHPGFTHILSTALKCLLLAALLSSCAHNSATPPAPTTLPTAAQPSPVPSPTPLPEITVNVWLTTVDKAHLLEPQPALTFGTAAGDGKVINVNENHRYQQMDGFGASMTDSSAWLLWTQMPEQQRTAVMTALFSPTEGIGLSLTRIPMGASDFTNGAHYTYDDMPPGQADPELAHFSIEHDRAYIIPALQEALKINPSLKILASPWSPPAWMKDSDSLTFGKLKREYYGALAMYFVKFIQAYQAEGLPIYAITLQNEPYYEPYSYPGMHLEPADEAELVKNYFKPAFEAAGITARILVWDHNWDKYEYPLAVLDDPEAKAALDGTAFHCYSGSVLAQGIVHDAHPDKDIYFTECSGGTWIAGFEAGFRSDMKNLVIGSIRNWARTINKWNLILDTKHNPHSGGCGTCDGLVTMDLALESGFRPNFDYFSIGHLSKFVQPGAYRIASSLVESQGLESVAFINPDGSKVLIVANTGYTDRSFSVQWGSRVFSYTLPDGAAATFTWQEEQDLPAAPARPTALTTVGSAGRVVLKWEFSPLAETYTIKRAEQPGGPYTLIAQDIRIPEYFDSQVKPGVTYFYVVSALNAIGESPDSDESSALP